MTKETNRLIERWPGFEEQSWPQRFAKLDRRYKELHRNFIDLHIQAVGAITEARTEAAARIEALSTECEALRGAVGQRDALIAETLGKLRIAQQLSDGEAVFWQRAADELEAVRTTLQQTNKEGDA